MTGRGPDDEERRRTQFHPFDLPRERAQRSTDDALRRCRAPLDERRRRLGIHAAGDEALGDVRQARDTHVADDRRVRIPGEEIPPHLRSSLLRRLVRGKEGHPHRLPPVSHRNAGVGGHRNPRGHPRDDLEGNPRLAQSLRLFAAPAEDVGIASLEAHDALAAMCESHEQRVDLFLRHGVVAGFLPHRMKGDAARQIGRQDRRRQPVVDDCVGREEAPPSLERQESGVARSGTDEGHEAGGDTMAHRRRRVLPVRRPDLAIAEKPLDLALGRNAGREGDRIHGPFEEGIEGVFLLARRKLLRAHPPAKAAG